MGRLHPTSLLWGAGALAVALGGAVAVTQPAGHDASAAVTPQPQAVPVSVATVESRDIVPWREFSGRLEAVERVALRSRVSGQVQALHFREGSLVKQGDLLVTIDPAPFAAAVAAAEAQVAIAEARVDFTRREYERARQLAATGNMPQRDLDSRNDAYVEAQASVRANRAALQTARLDLGYTEIRAPVAGRIGKAEVTVGNLVAAGAGAPVLATLYSVSPMYAGFDADEHAVAEALAALRRAAGPAETVESIPVQMSTLTGETVRGHVQMIDNAVDAGSGTVRVRAVFDNADGGLMPGQFARLRMGQAAAVPTLLVSERAVGTDQDKKYVLVLGTDDTLAYREVALGAAVDGLRAVTDGLKAGERIVVNGLQRVRAGALVAPQPVPMTTSGETVAQR